MKQLLFRGMKVIGIVLLLTGFFLFPFPGSGTAKAAAVDSRTGVDKDLPIEIVSNRLDAYHEKRLVVFSGDAVATQGGRTIKADRLSVYYKKNQAPAQTIGSKRLEGTGDLDRIEAKGRVTVTEGDRVVTGHDAVFDHDAQKITMTGNAVMQEGQNIIHGETIVVYLKENRGVVEGAENKRVKATIYPKNEEGKK